ncbi:hypothetical protein FHS29_003098 [Saccharothrix tamanrassetensis]|uniref:Uncharacterized protein n=1 Tax=Saccharothrix tamanrassetensis TaxID=1051531 RepID=A0A841CDB1_9PSEU|nr:hypothetical protein [Saccharothrix tamanrassetensis]MBB5956512.1 hypothetical protein [Saccharothrix tamanrassetensis]
MGTEEEWPIEQTWSLRNTHWHAYVEHTSLDHASPRQERLERTPEEVLTTPAEVAAWLEVNLRSATKPEEAGKKRTKDERDFSDSNRVHASLASAGESIYTGVKGMLTLAVEAVTPDECRSSHDGADVAPLKAGRRR